MVQWGTDFKYINQPYTSDWNPEATKRLFGRWNSLFSASWSNNISFWQLCVAQKYVQVQLGRLHFRCYFGRLARKKSARL